MAKRKYLQLVLHDETEWEHYEIHEALLDSSTGETYWIGSKAIRKFDKYHDAVEYWSKAEKLSGVKDILTYTEIQDIIDRVDYEDEQELEF